MNTILEVLEHGLGTISMCIRYTLVAYFVTISIGYAYAKWPTNNKRNRFRGFDLE